MRRHLLWLLVIFIICSSAIYDIDKKHAQETITSDISFSIYKSIDYTSCIYSNATAQLHITVEKVSNNNRVIVWNKTFGALLLRDYPEPENAFIQVVTIPGMHNSNEHLEVTYTCTYNSNGYELKVKNTAVIDGVANNKMNIGI